MSWKAQGGINRIEQNSSISVNNLVADRFTLKDIYRGQWDICGGLSVRDESLFMGNVVINHNTLIGGNVDILGSMNVLDTNIIGDIFVADNAYVRKNIYMDLSGGTTLHGENRKFGFNMTSPQSTIDISGDLVRTIDIHSSLLSNKNVVARNATDKGLTMNIDSNGAYIDFYVDNSMNSAENYNARLLCEPGGKFTIDVTNTMQFKPRIIFSEVSTDDIIADERIVIYDNSQSNVQYLKDVYDASYLKTGTAMFLVAGDNSSNVFFRTSTREGRGLTLGGGYFPGNRINGTIALIDTSNNKYPALNIVSGPTANGAIIPKNLRTSVGVNKYDVYQTAGGENRYAMDVNGPVRLAHQEVIVAADVAFQVYEMSFYGLVGVAIGTPIRNINNVFTQYFLKTVDGGYTWTANRIVDQFGDPFTSLEQSSIIFQSIYLINATKYLIGGTGRYLFYSDNGIYWKQISVSTSDNFTFNIESLYLNLDILILGFTINTGISSFGYIVHQNLDNLGDGTLTNLGLADPNFQVVIDPVLNPVHDTSLNSVNAIWGNAMRIIVVGNSGLRAASIIGGQPVFDAMVSSATQLYGVHGYIYGGITYSIAVGINAIHYSRNGGVNWYSIAISGTLRSVEIVNSSCAIAVGDAGLIMYSIDGYATWSTVSNDTLNAMGNGGIISGVNFTNITATDINRFSISGTVTQYVAGSVVGRTKMYHLYAPYLLNRVNHTVLEASGNMVVSGDFWIRESGRLLTNNSTFYLLPENTNNINIGSSGTGNTNVRNRFTVAGTTQVCDLSAQNADFTGDMRVQHIDTLNSDSLFLGASTTIVNLGRSGGEVHILGNLFLPGSIFSDTVTNVEIENKTILLNDNNPSIHSSPFTGIYIRDDLNDLAGHILTNGTRTGYSFKTAASPNRVNLDISGLTLSGYMAAAGRGLLTLKPNYILDVSADYTISTDTIYISDISMLDVSLNRRVLKNVLLSTATTQVVDTKFASSAGLYVGKFEVDFIPNSALDIGGNAFVSRLGLGTNGVNMDYSFDVSGSAYISKNVDISGNISVQNNIFNYGTIYRW